MSENKNEVYSARMSIEPLDAKSVLTNMGALINSYYGLIEKEDVELKIEIRKSNSIQIILVILALPPAIDASVNLIERLDKFLNKRKKKAIRENRKFEFSFKTSTELNLKHNKKSST